MDLEALTKGSDFVFDNTNRMYYKYHRMSISHAGQYINTSDYMKNKKVTINQKITIIVKHVFNLQQQQQ